MDEVSVPLWVMVMILTGIGGIVMFILTRAWDTLKEISKDVKTTNGQIVKLNTWTQMHEKIDDERHKETVGVHADLWEKLNDHIDRRKAL